MKGRIVKEKCSRGEADVILGSQGWIKHIIIPEADNLTLRLCGNEILVYTWPETGTTNETRFVKEVEVPDEWIKKAIAYKKVQDDFFQLEPLIEKLLL